MTDTFGGDVRRGCDSFQAARRQLLSGAPSGGPPPPSRSAGLSLDSGAAPETPCTDGGAFWQLAVDLCAASHDAPTVPCIDHQCRAYDRFLHGAPDPAR